MALVYVGVYLARLECSWAKSLKEKRSVIKPITERLKVRYPVSVARLDGLNELGWERVGVTAISSDAVWLESLLNKVHHFIANQGTVRIEEHSSVVEVWDEFE